MAHADRRHVKKNVLWIMVDQMRADMVGYDGNNIVQTPYIDGLAARSTIFERAYSQCPLCTPSRASLFTGRYMRGHGAWWNGMPISGTHVLLPELLRAQDYKTAIIGKLHLNPTAAEHGFDHKELHEERLEDELSSYGRFLEKNGCPGRFPRSFTEWDFVPTGICHMPEEIEETRWVADRTDEYLRQARSAANRVADLDRPFFLFSSFIRPHSPYNPLPRFDSLYEGVGIPLPPFAADEYETLPPRIREFEAIKGWDKFSPEEWLLLRRRYYALCSQVDDGVGRVLESLERYGFSDNTVVIFTSDHGDFVGDHGIMGKGHPWESALRVPLIVYDPDVDKSPVRMTDLVELVDVMPSLLDALDIDVPDCVQGKSFLPSIREARAGVTDRRPHRDVAIAETVTHSIDDQVFRVLDACENRYLISIHSERYHYIRYTNEIGELYDLETDPDERKNLFQIPEYSPVVVELEKRILDWFVTTDEFQTPDPDNSYFAAYFSHGGDHELRSKGLR
jgi:arylsulfatase